MIDPKDPNAPPEADANILVKSVIVSVAVDLTTGKPIEGQAWKLHMEGCGTPKPRWKEVRHLLTEGIRITDSFQEQEGQSRIVVPNGPLNLH